MIENLVKIAKAEVGVREVGGNNKGKRIREYQAAATDLEVGPWAWCAAFVDWVILQWLADPKNVSWLSLKTTTPAKWRPTTAGAFALKTWAQKRKSTVQIFGDDIRPRAGDIVIFDFSHCGIVTGSTSTRMQTVEGNTNGRGDRDSTSGDGVWAKDRALSLAQNYLRIQPSKA